ncbi:(Fe-S)-binding protein [Conexibacter sp. CPCC 206217]|uniref:(Fe-S)-binding protein n=1 Tax=Conexibacter sp. CPCC 206217 TaxID=3064574 RepID=UPI002726CAEE|nr:heterodisulfide reductase-related iron-sulfur binding cluster [Conexibacter sp. CPCC 206217]MDO8211077.1 heterodisulfide reductase-related iron-sulfur binding cluster [Conexibacter sp. CPCC 206217]
MQHAIDTARLGPRGEAMAGAIGSCVHCGFCLPTCPTYVTLGEEMDSPRGRIFLMKEVLEGGLALEQALPAIDNCLGCQACQTACPSGVEYGDLITSFRAHAEPLRRRPAAERAQRAIALRTLPHPRRFRLAAWAGVLSRPLARHVPPAAPMLRVLPPRVPRAGRALPAVHPAIGTRRARVALLAGCAQQVLAPEINWATLRVLAHNGVETVIPQGQGCCGALAMHTGAADQALPLARRNLAAFPADVDAVITNAAGCGSGMREYGLLFAGEPEQEQAEAFAARVLDVSAFLAELGLAQAPPEQAGPRTIAYQDACHLAHAQRVRSAPRRLLAAIPGVTLAQPADWELCCGSAGTYNVERPQIAAQLGERKARTLLDTAPDLIASGNIGCISQLGLHLRQLGRAVPVLHTMQVLDRAYAGRL